MNATNTSKKPSQRQTKAVSHAKQVPPPQVIAEIHLIPIERINIEAQVRTEFDPESIKELAADIEARGLRQPVEVTPIGDERYRLTLGERRLRAVELLGQKAVPAIILKSNDQDRLVDQLAENIQREDLSLKDLSAAVRKLFDKFKSLDAVAGRVKKSKPWVSKHLALSYESFGMRAKALLESGVTEDIDLLNILSQIEKVDFQAAWKAANEIRGGTMNREQARTFLKELKEAKKKQQADYEAKEAKRRAAEKKKLEESMAAEADLQEKLKNGTGEEFIEWSCMSLEELLLNEFEDDNATAFLNRISQPQRDALQLHIEQIASANSDPARAIAFWAQQLMPAYRQDMERVSFFEEMAIIVGMTKQKPELYALVAVIEATTKKSA